MAYNGNEDLQMTTRRQARIDYELLNGGPDSPEGVLPSDQITESDISQFFSRSPWQFNSASTDQESLAFSEISPHESASQTFTRKIKKPRPAPTTEWIWDYFSTTEVSREWKVLRTGKPRTIDMDIQCTVIDDKTGLQCNWKTSDSQRQSSTSNMQRHLERKHSVLPPQSSKPKQRIQDIRKVFTKQGNLSIQEQLERNILRWIIQDKQAFLVIESQAFQQIFEDIPGITLPFKSRSTVSRRLQEQFKTQRSILKENLATTCKTIALSLDIWTSQNHYPILGIIGHWLTEDFHYREETLEFCEIFGPHTGENIATVVYKALVELDLTSKLTTITGDNASNVQEMVDELWYLLEQNQNPLQPIRFSGPNSYIRCLAHILNLIVKDILRSLKSGSVSEANSICDNLQSRNSQSTSSATTPSILSQSPLAKLRILAIWISRSPQRRQDWKSICDEMKLDDKFIEYDVEIRWNSTFRMLDDGIQARPQINRFCAVQGEIPPFTNAEWEQLGQIHKALKTFNDLTHLVSISRPQISLTVPVYYKLHDLLRDDALVGYDDDIANAMRAGMKKYQKYYDFMDNSEAYYTALMLDPQLKGDLILHEMVDQEAAQMIILETRRMLHKRYPPLPQSIPSSLPQSNPDSNPRSIPDSTQEDSLNRKTMRLWMLKKLQPQEYQFVSDIDQYFDSPRVTITGAEDPDWLCNWWRTHKGEYPQMAEAAREFLAIPASEVSVERLFSRGRDLLGVRRHSLGADTMRMLMLMKDIV
jgi:hAT family C-terminal dimerisation region